MRRLTALIFLSVFIVMNVSGQQSVREALFKEEKLKVIIFPIKYGGEISLPDIISVQDFSEKIVAAIQNENKLKKAKILFHAAYQKNEDDYLLSDSITDAQEQKLIELLLEVGYDEEFKRIMTVQRTVSQYLRNGLFKTGNFDMINFDFGAEVQKEYKASLKGISRDSNKSIDFDFSPYIVTGYYVPLDKMIFISLYIMHFETGEILLSAFEECENDSDEIYQTVTKLCFSLVGKVYKHSASRIDDQSANNKDRISGFSVVLNPSRGGSAKTVLMETRLKSHSFYGHKFKLPPLLPGEYKLIVEKENYHTLETILFINEAESREVKLYLQHKHGSIFVQTPNERNSYITLNKNSESMQQFADEIMFRKLLTGNHQVKIEKDNYYPVTKTVKLMNQDEKITLKIDLKVKPVKTVFTSNIKGTHVFVDKVFYGITPFIRKLPDGYHNVVFQHNYFTRDTTNVSITEPHPYLVKGAMRPDVNKIKLKREVFPHFFWTLSTLWGYYSADYLAAVNPGVDYLNPNGGNGLFNFALDLSIGLDFEFFFFGAKSLFTFYNQKPGWVSNNDFGINFNVIPYLGFKLYAGHYTSFNFGFGFDIPVFSSLPQQQVITFPMSSTTASDYFSHFSNYMFMFGISFYNKYKREVFGFEYMMRFDFIDKFIYPGQAQVYNSPVFTYFGIKFPFCYTSSKKRMEKKDYSSYIGKKQDHDSYLEILEKNEIILERLDRSR